ncbi:MAG: HAD-IA family hydrolase [Betaproteobacteria bacterium]|nr:HAD-IA family hydrolase [Betaproteobacteria bacterium]
MIEAVLFDLDGTLADTAPDLCAALNLLLAEQGKLPLTLAQARPYASSGARGMLDVGLGVVPGDAGYAAYVQRLLKHYERTLCQATVLFPGIIELLAKLDMLGIRWGIVTNKAQRYTLPLIEALGLRQRCACIVSGDSSPRLKPHPEPLLLACVAAQAPSAHSLYVGDDLRDILAGRAAGIGTVAAAYGYLGAGAAVAAWQADAIVSRPEEILSLLGERMI